MEKEKSNGGIILLIILAIWFWYDHGKLKDEIAYLEDDNSALEDALYRANSNIQDAQSYVWESYDDMGYALENLETVQPQNEVVNCIN